MRIHHSQEVILKSIKGQTHDWGMCSNEDHRGRHLPGKEEASLPGPLVKRKAVFINMQCGASLVAQLVKNPPAVQETWVRSLGWEDPLEKEMATHPSVLAWRIPWTEEPAGLQSIGSQRVKHD